MTNRFHCLIGTDVLTYRWIIPLNTPVALGDLVVVTDNYNGMKYISRVTGMTHESETGGIKVSGFPIGCIDSDGTFRKPRTIPPLYAPVRSMDPDEITILKRFMGEIEVGMIKSGYKQVAELPVGIPSSVLNQHLGIFATTGMGKSNLMKVICASAIITRNAGILITDPHGEYATGHTDTPITLGLVHHPMANDGLSVYTIRQEDIAAKYLMKPLKIGYSDLTIGDLGLVFELSPAQMEVINLLLPFNTTDIFDFFINEDVDSLPSRLRTTAYIGNHQDIAQRIRSAVPDALRLVQRQVKTLLDLTSKFLFRQESSIQNILADLDNNRVVLIDIPGISEAAELFLLSAISRAIFRSHQTRFFNHNSISKSGTVLISIEEAQRVLSEHSGKIGIFREIAMEGRKFGVGIGVITQQPKSIDSRVLAQINTLFVMGLADQKDRDILESSAKHDLRILDTEIQTLDRGDAVISTVGIPFPVSCRIHNYEEYLELIKENLS